MSKHTETILLSEEYREDFVQLEVDFNFFRGRAEDGRMNEEIEVTHARLAGTKIEVELEPFRKEIEQKLWVVAQFENLICRKSL